MIIQASGNNGNPRRESRGRENNLLDGDPSFQIGILRIVVIVIAAAAGICETERGLRLAS